MQMGPRITVAQIAVHEKLGQLYGVADSTYGAS
jgi:hypothetical protein